VQEKTVEKAVNNWKNRKKFALKRKNLPTNLELFSNKC
jgi:hypothetical protein